MHFFFAAFKLQLLLQTLSPYPKHSRSRSPTLISVVSMSMERLWKACHSVYMKFGSRTIPGPSGPVMPPNWLIVHIDPDFTRDAPPASADLHCHTLPQLSLTQSTQRFGKMHFQLLVITYSSTELKRRLIEATSTLLRFDVDRLASPRSCVRDGLRGSFRLSSITGHASFRCSARSLANLRNMLVSVICISKTPSSN